ncbi:helix-turn-helix transcriptional regulator [Enterobacter ludwigii]|jgi:DNA-binding CsgD family transcriptional regulator|nr:helix-turn-helix transcriptional regulator [Enterobacter ludwigii]
MKVKVVSSNYYFYYGLSLLLKREGYQLTEEEYTSENITKKDLLILHIDRAERKLHKERIEFCSGVNTLLLLPSPFIKYLKDIDRQIKDEHLSVSDVLNVVNKFIGLTNKPHKPAIFTEREKHIICCSLEGVTIKAISKQLGVTNKTIYAQRSSAYQKFGARNLRDLFPVKDFLFWHFDKGYAFKRSTLDLNSLVENKIAP